MGNEKYFFKEDAFGEMYEDSFLADEFPVRKSKNSEEENTTEAAEISAATARVRLSNEIDAGQQASKAISTAFDIGGNFGGGSSHNFPGQIFGGI
jgi:hypothetical protein